MAKVNKGGKEAEEELRWVTDSGKVITEEVAEQMAEDFEKNPPDLSEWKRRYVGRPSLSTTGRSPRVSFRAPMDLYHAAWQRADKEGRSLSSLAREALERYLDS
jgi:hypothetical protein